MTGSGIQAELQLRCGKEENVALLGEKQDLFKMFLS